jgi:hypothetical protein
MGHRWGIHHLCHMSNQRFLTLRWLSGFLVLMLGWSQLDLAAAGLVLVQPGDVWRYHKGTNEPVADWKTTSDASLDSTWLSGVGGIGYGDALPGETTKLNDMRNLYTSVYLRRSFEITELVDTNLHLQLTVDYDDGLIAYLDGLPLRRINVPDGDLNYTATASGDHEASCCSSPTNPASVIDLGLVRGRLGIGTHVLAIHAMNSSKDSSDFHALVGLQLVTNTPPDGGVSGNLTEDTRWTADKSPYLVVGTVTVDPGVTLTIEPGVSVLFGAGLGMEIEGRLLAEGTADRRITFGRRSGTGAWGRLDFAPSDLESRIAYADIDGAGGEGNIRTERTRIHLDHVTFLNTKAQLVTMDDSSCVIQNCHFPSIENNELLHFFRMPANGYAILSSNLFGTPGIPVTSGYNDIIDFTGGNRPGPIAQFIGNTFLSAVDDCFDMDGTDAHIEGNVFLNVRQDAARSSSSNPITTGEDNFGGNDTSQLVICRNIFYNVEHFLLLKEHGSALVQNNTIIRLRDNPIADYPGSVINFGEPKRGAGPGFGAIFEGNIVWDSSVPLAINYQPEQMFLQVNHSLIQGTNHPGIGNLSSDPLFVNPSDLSYLAIRESLSLKPGSPAIGTGPNGLDMGAMVPGGASISGEPPATTTLTSASLRVAGPGIVSYRWRINGGLWSEEVPLTTNILFSATMFDNARPIEVLNLSPGTYGVEVLGKNSAGVWQDQASPTRSRTWTVVADDPPLLIGAVRLTSGVLQLEFSARAGRSYSVLYADNVAGVWLKLKDIAAGVGDSIMNVEDAVAASGQRYYRLVSPAIEP